MQYYKIQVVGPLGGRNYYVKTTDFTLVELLDLLQQSQEAKEGHLIKVSFSNDFNINQKC